ncbi:MULTISPECIES: helix-turn-helix domain-containing protein [unclassified Rathayibacter]|uniref:helix-turn-helix transcriptional regulator n=1 Tax=unclassified Rathayibacter TaxID=2609250 RepID=UPI00104A4E6E|nr:MULTISPECIES: helix-turn-helix domain-containing protein [unclassified Rathayibacter]TCL84802.1 AlpA family transcriptional regulator [Rathayibacter sp. PhB192]TCM30520.1 AlpA family transcriptional regulator [Rathayibacter sp. PhB179]
MTIQTARVASRYLDVHDVAIQLGISVATLYRWRSIGADMPKGFKVGSKLRFTQESVDAWIEAQQAKAVPA